MTRQHSTPLLIDAENKHAVSLHQIGHESGLVSEVDIQALVQAHPSCLPIAEVDPIFLGVIPICTELSTPAGRIDNFMVTPSGLPVLVECKLWKNPEGRREVITQILDYAKELSRWSSSDLQRAVSSRLKQEGNALLALVRAVHPHLDEVQFNDALTANLRRGRFLLLIVGDGIREGVENIAEYLQNHMGLRFSLGLVELPIYEAPDHRRLVVPRVLARTTTITRTVVEVPQGFKLQEDGSASLAEDDPDNVDLINEPQQFWAEFLQQLKLDDPEQPKPKPAKQGYLVFSLPAPGGNCWLTVFRNLHKGELGVVLSSARNTAGDYATQVIADDWEAVKGQLGGTARVTEKDGKRRIEDALVVGPLQQEQVRRRGFAWLAERVNSFVNIMRPRVRSAVADYERHGS